jgi:hypothetical protein
VKAISAASTKKPGKVLTIPRLCVDPNRTVYGVEISRKNTVPWVESIGAFTGGVPPPG